MNDEKMASKDLDAVLQELKGQLVDVDESPLRELSTRKEMISSSIKNTKDTFERYKADIEQIIETLRKKLGAEQQKMEETVVAMDHAVRDIDKEMQALEDDIETQKRLRECVHAVETQQVAVRKQERERTEARIAEVEKLVSAKSEVVSEMEADIANALEEANEVIQQDTMKYRTVYSKYLRENNAEESGRDELERGVEAVAGGSSGVVFLPKKTKEKTKTPFCWEKPGENFLQPDPKGLAAKDKVKYSRFVRSAFVDSLATLDDKMVAMCKDIKGVNYEIGPQKDDVRLFEKARLSYKSNLRRVTDYERRSFVCTTFGGALEVFNCLVGSVNIIRIKNRFAKCNVDAKDSGGYRDLQVVVKLDNEFMVEIQLHLTIFHDLKTKVAGQKNNEGKTGHDRYKTFRQLKEQADFIDVASCRAELAVLQNELNQLKRT